MPEEIESLVGLLILLVSCIVAVLVIFGKKIRSRKIQGLATSLGYNFSEVDEDFLKQNPNLRTLHEAPETTCYHFIQGQNGTASTTFCEMDYMVTVMGNQAQASRSVILIKHPDLNLPHFYIFRENPMMKMGGMVKDVGSQLAEGLEEAGVEVFGTTQTTDNGAPPLNTWANSGGIKLASHPKLNKKHGVQSTAAQNLNAFLDNTMVESIIESGDTTWEGCGNVLVLCSNHKKWSVGQIKEYLEHSQCFLTAALAKN